LLFCVALGIVYAFLVASKLPNVIVAIFFVVLGTISLALLAPATRAFAGYQRQALAQQGAAGDARNARALNADVGRQD
jgi:predicted membrane channel-forming protein YqfA (hemolysin III family)